MIYDKYRGWNSLPQFSKDMYNERYFLEGEDYNDWVERVASAYSDDDYHKDRIALYIKNYWFHPATPVSSNAGTDRGLPISCFVNNVEDSKEGIFDVFNENFRLGAHGGGIGTNWSAVREVGSKIGDSGESSGIIPFIKVSDASTLAVSQGGLRRASQAVYLDISHPEVEEIIELRKPTGDSNRRCLNVHHGLVIPDVFMEAVEARTTWDLISPKDGKVVKTVDAFDLWTKILQTRVETGEPYLLFKDTVNNLVPYEYSANGMKVSTSNLCSEITLYTNVNYTGVCCLGSINVEYYEEYQEFFYDFIYDVTRFLDNVLQDFIDRASNIPGFEKSVASAEYERSIGLGVMGYANLLQKNKLPWDSPMAFGLNNNLFSVLKDATVKANVKAAKEFGPCPLAESVHTDRRNTHVTAIAPTASISTLCNNTSQGIDPLVANVYVHKTNIGSYTIRNKFLDEIIHKQFRGEPTAINDCWNSIQKNEGSVQHLEWMDEWTKDVFKTAYELNQQVVVQHAADRAEYIDQAQSTNLFFPADAHVADIYNSHMRAWKGGCKSLYYCRSKALNRATIGDTVREVIPEANYDECLSCQ